MQKRFLAICMMVSMIFGTIGQNPFASAGRTATARPAPEAGPDAEFPFEEEFAGDPEEGMPGGAMDPEAEKPGAEDKPEEGMNEAGAGEEQKPIEEEKPSEENQKQEEEQKPEEAKSLGTTITTSDGSTYEIEVTYSDGCGVPTEGTELLVSEILPDEADYDSYVAASMEQLGAEDERVLFARVFDITIADKKDHSIVCEPNGEVRVSIRLTGTDLDAYAKVDVLHITEQKTRGTKSGAKAAPAKSYNVDKMNATAKDDTVEFSTDGFSVYVIIGHEGGEVVTPRVEFHFVAPTEANAVVQSGIAYYTSTPYVFRNKHDNYQTTMIVCDGDKLESIEAPMNTEEAYFYGWYTVIGDRVNDTASYNPNTDTWTGNVTYSWPSETKRVELDKVVSVSATKDSNGAIQSITWSIDGVSDTITDTSMIDADGCAHVYLAPIYENYHFVNFHLGSYGETTATNIMARKLAVFGNDSTTSVRIGDITAPSTDPVHQIFVGWEYDINAHNDNPAQFVTVSTIDMSGNEIVQPGKDGTYLDVTADDVDLYPVFVQARWINFSLGASGNGALYVGPQFMYTSDYDDYPLEGKLPVPTRNGYDFDGWYLSEDADKNGTGVKIAEADGSIVNGVSGAEFIYPDGSSLSDGTTEFRITADGKLYVYEALNELTLYAKWKIHHDDITYKVIIWKQKVTDDPNAADADKTYDYYTYFLRDYDYDTSGDSFIVSVSDSDQQYAANNPNGDFTGFHYRTCDPATTVDPQGGTVLNVYYDRDLTTLLFYRYMTSGYVETTSNTGTQYAYINDAWVPLTYTDGIWYAPTTIEHEERFERTNTLTSGGEYLIVSTGEAGNGYALGHSGTSIVSDQVTIVSGTQNYIMPSDVDQTSVWTVAGAYSFSNGNYYVNRSNNVLQINTNSNTWNWNNNSNQLYYGNNNNRRYLRYNGSFELSSTASSIYLYKKNIVAVYSGATPYAGPRYIVSSGNSNSWRIYKAFTGLYGQTFAQCGYTWPSEYDWYDGHTTTGTQTGSGTRITFLDTFNADSEGSYYAKDRSTGNNSFNHYKQNVDGTWPGIDEWANQTPKDGNSTTWNFSEKYDGFEVKYYASGTQQNATSSWNSENFWNEIPASRTASTGTNSFYIRYARKQFNLSFSANYPDTYASEEPEAVVIPGVYYEASLSGYSTQTAPVAPGNGEYYFVGWYEDASGTEPFDFTNNKMPAANKIIYAKWALVEFPIHIDPNGGVIDHIKYSDSSAAGLAATGLAYAGTDHYDGSKATYFDNLATQTISRYENVERPYVEVSDAEAAQMNENEVYRYVYTYFSGREGGQGKLGSDARNAVYILNTEASLQAYYEFYVAQVIARQARDPELQPLPRAQWESVYVSTAKYRELRSGEHYEFLGW